MTEATGPCAGLRVIDLTRVLAGPVCAQILGDFGADVIKVERPGEGDDSRKWGPPYLKDRDGRDTSESAYYLCANRNKRSVALDLSRPEDLAALDALLSTADVLVENFKVGSLAKLGLSYEQLREKYPRLIYCSITGYGQTGPLASEPGYDFIIQGLSGFMSNTGPVEGPPTKAGVAVIDYVTGLNAAIGILGALHHRDQTGQGQHIDIALLDSAMGMMTNLAQYTLTSGANPPRVGNAHTTIVPYNAFAAGDGWIILTIGNDHQFQAFCAFADCPEWAGDARFIHNAARLENRDALTQLLADTIRAHNAAYWIQGLNAAGVPCGPVHAMQEALATEQVRARNMVIDMQHSLSDKPIQLVGSPYKFSASPVSYRYAPPTLGQNQNDVLKEIKP